MTLLGAMGSEYARLICLRYETATARRSIAWELRPLDRQRPSGGFAGRPPSSQTTRACLRLVCSEKLVAQHVTRMTLSPQRSLTCARAI